MEWYVLHVRTGRELAIKAELNRQGYTASAPEELRTERRGGAWKDTRRVIIPGYVFLFISLTDSDYYRISGIPHVIRFLGARAPEPLPAADAEYITWLSSGGAAPLEPSDIMIVEGDEVKVMSGPLKGREGMIVKLNRRQRRAVLAITMAGRTHEISLSVNVLLKSPSAKQG